MDWKLREGRFITEEDVNNASQICVLGEEAATDLFGNKIASWTRDKNSPRC